MLNTNISVRYNANTDWVQIYYNDVWNNWKLVGFIRLNLMQRGIIHADYTVQLNSSNQNENGITISQRANASSYWPGFAFKEKVDLTEYTKLHIRKATTAGWVYAEVMSNIDFTWNHSVIKNAAAERGATEIEVDISNIYGMYYIQICNNITQGTGTVCDVWLE